MRNRMSDNVCTACRARKVRCEGRSARSGRCENCARLDFRCSFSNSAVEDPEGNAEDGRHVAGVVPRRRARLACQPCKALKARCSGDQPSCRRCQEKHIKCVYLPSKRTNNARMGRSSRDSAQAAPTVDPERSLGYSENSPTDGNITSDGAQLYETMEAAKNVYRRHIEAFFDLVYPNPDYSFIHKAVFLQMWQAGEIDTVLLKAICGVASPFMEGRDDADRKRGKKWIDEAQAELLASFDKPSIIRLQALQVLVLHHQATRQFRKLLFLFSLTTRMAFLLRINYEDPSLPFLAQETRRRLMWSIFTTDTFLAGGIPDFTLVRSSQVHIRLPCEEPSFQLDHPVETEPLHPESDQSQQSNIGLLGYLIRVIDIRDRILRYTKEIVGTDNAAATIRSTFQNFELELERLRASLPSNMSFNSKNLYLRAYSKTSLPRFVLLHVWWHQCHCDLFRFLIPGFRESVSRRILERTPNDFLQYCRVQCVSHAREIAGIFHTLNNLDQDVPMTDSKLAVPAYQCANILSRSIYMAVPGEFDIYSGISACCEFTKRLAYYNEMASLIRDDIQRILEHGTAPISLSRQRTPEADESSPVSGFSSDLHRHKFSRHNVISEAGIEDNSSALNLRDASDTTSPQTQATPKASVSAIPNTGFEQTQTSQAAIPGPQQALAEQQSAIQQAYASAPDFQVASMNFGEMMDAGGGSWNLGEPGGDEIDMDFLFDPLWRIQNQWDIGF